MATKQAMPEYITSHRVLHGFIDGAEGKQPRHITVIFDTDAHHPVHTVEIENVSEGEAKLVAKVIRKMPTAKAWDYLQ